MSTVIAHTENERRPSSPTQRMSVDRHRPRTVRHDPRTALSVPLSTNIHQSWATVVIIKKNAIY